MPGRSVPLVNNQIYHIFNRGIDRCITFKSKREYFRAIESIRYYQIDKLTMSLSKYLSSSVTKKKEISKLNEKGQRIITLFCFCLMPNHFHFLVKQDMNNGISNFMSKFQNSYTKYFNKRNNRDGSLFLDQFKAVRIETDEQLLHVSRYIHLNPYTNYIVRSVIEIEKYPWSSLNFYLNNKSNMISTGQILSKYKNNKEYLKFVIDQKDYQRRLKEIEYLLFD